MGMMFGLGARRRKETAGLIREIGGGIPEEAEWDEADAGIASTTRLP